MEAMESELRSLQGESLVASSGKLAYLDRMLLRLRRDGSRVLLFRCSVALVVEEC